MLSFFLELLMIAKTFYSCREKEFKTLYNYFDSVKTLCNF